MKSPGSVRVYFFGGSFKLAKNSTTSRSSRRDSFSCKSAGIALGPVRRLATSSTATVISLFSAVTSLISFLVLALDDAAHGALVV